jgi:hypothetical protein
MRCNCGDGNMSGAMMNCAWGSTSRHDAAFRQGARGRERMEEQRPGYASRLRGSDDSRRKCLPPQLPDAQESCCKCYGTRFYLLGYGVPRFGGKCETSPSTDANANVHHESCLASWRGTTQFLYVGYFILYFMGEPTLKIWAREWNPRRRDCGCNAR